jgi:hypothetical protein
VLSGRGLCDELITRPEESYRLWCVVVCDLETSRIGASYIYDISHLRVSYVHNGKSSHVLVAYDNQKKNTGGCFKYKGNRMYCFLVHFRKVDSYPCCCVYLCVSVSLPVSVSVSVSRLCPSLFSTPLRFRDRVCGRVRVRIIVCLPSSLHN